ncbi:NAD-dependent protein deacetylase, SIR2 family [Caminicella sporogenes DSM 14501]|uniref:protein acetyllysine N-acetyltransferase n=1 Tax=Caminicella sporogenes DSM 14501 TaxID=1121266 RepID=A0A1M6KZ85_9FIRM|nr:Sir2 family NAD-dependent protein deacetylase [Caminicella sporogenes]RKD27650.1 hypothetical protein BET04_00865 [Caminicella sporogenes]SHJ64156.1 NAD-dependent protein deacetylase, SIR2 family [Caminicella sporogenes DSM 14501]
MNKIVVFTGAGVSKDSGVPTFEDLGDLRQKLSRRYFNENPEDFYKILKKLDDTAKKAEPNPAHIAIAKYNIPVITMNIDSLHKRAGSTNVIEIHGNLEYVYCPKCRKKYDIEIAYKNIYSKCCSEVLNPNVVLYGDMIPKYTEALELVTNTEMLLVIGTSFYTSTATDLVGWAKRAGAKIEIINQNAKELVPKFLRDFFNK